MAAKSNTNELGIKDICNILFESAAEALIVTTQDGTIRIINSSVEEMFRYKKKELVEKKVEMLMPEKYGMKHISHRKGYNTHPSKRSMGIGLNLTGHRKDGSIFPVEISLNHFEMEGKKMVIALVSDISERRKILLTLDF